MSEDVECPYCEAWNEINHDDGYGYEEGIRHEIECSECGKNFVFTTEISFYYEGFKADCLNGKEHNFKQNHCYPKVFTEMCCADCDEKRKPTPDEWRTILTIDEIAKAKIEYPNCKWIIEL